jgi:hypothetical protein
MKVITVFHIHFAFGREHRLWLFQKERAQNGDNYIIQNNFTLHLIMSYEFARWVLEPTNIKLCSNTQFVSHKKEKYFD